MTSNKITIAVDASGGDYAPHEIVKGAVKAAQKYKVDIALVGRKAILEVLVSHYWNRPGISIVAANQAIAFDEHPVNAIRGKPNSSIVVGVNMVQQSEAAAFVSAGNTGALMAAALFILGKIEGVERPPLCSIVNLYPTIPALLLDAGANADCRPRHLLQFADLGGIYARYVLDIEKPLIGLLSNGEEDTKGNHLTVESHKLMRQSKLNFFGNIEGHDIAKRTVDVIVTDGFTGNVVVKTVEGLGERFVRLRRYRRSLAPSSLLGGQALAQEVGQESLVKGMDYREYGGACLLGVKGNIIAAHGRSQAAAITNAIGLAIRTAEQQVSDKISQEVSPHDSAESDS